VSNRMQNKDTAVHGSVTQSTAFQSIQLLGIGNSAV
jgi:hypothetical protein